MSTVCFHDQCAIDGDTSYNTLYCPIPHMNGARLILISVVVVKRFDKRLKTNCQYGLVLSRNLVAWVCLFWK